MRKERKWESKTKKGTIFRVSISTKLPVLDMAHLPNLVTLQRLLNRHRRSIGSIPTQFPSDRSLNTVVSSLNFLLLVYPSFSGKRWLSGNAEWADPPDFAGLNAYDVLGVSQTSSFAEIKASFRKLAKETHPDLARSQKHSSYASKKFIQILAAYEVPLFFCKSNIDFTCQMSEILRSQYLFLLFVFWIESWSFSLSNSFFVVAIFWSGVLIYLIVVLNVTLYVSLAVTLE